MSFHASRSRAGPKARHAFSQQQLKGEDIVFVYDHLEKLHSSPEKFCTWSLYCICDGHGGAAAAEFLKENLGVDLIKRLPQGMPPEVLTADNPWLEKIRMALIDSFLSMDTEFAKEGLPPSIGTTVTLALQCGWLLTLANIGDSECFLDVGNRKEYEFTTSHKIDTNVQEQARLRSVGKTVRPLSQDLFQPAEEDEQGVGPMRVWPCGLAVSRSIGDYDCGCEITAAPHVQQIELPTSGARMMMASDGLWDHVTGRKAMKLCRKLTLKECPLDLIELAENKSEDGLTDDTTVLVVDFMPTTGVDWREACKAMRSPGSMLRRFKERMKGDLRNAVPRRISNYDGVKHSTCAYMGEAVATQMELEKSSEPNLATHAPHKKYNSDTGLLAVVKSDNLDTDLDQDSDSDDDQASVNLKRRKEKLAAASSHLGLNKDQVTAAQATRRVLIPSKADEKENTPS